METSKLLELTFNIARKLIDRSYLSDYTRYDREFIVSTDAKKPFIWLVRNSGTSLHRSDVSEALDMFVEVIEYYKSCNINDYTIYIYDGNTLAPTSTVKILEIISVQQKLATTVDCVPTSAGEVWSQVRKSR